MTTIKERVLEYAKYKQYTLESFFSSIGVTYGAFKGKNKETGLTSNVIDKLLTIYPDINPTWLISGVGPMIADGSLVQIGHADIKSGSTVTIGGVSATTNVVAPEDRDKEVAQLKERIAELERDKEMYMRMVETLIGNK